MYSAKKGQSKYLHAIVMYEAKLNRMLVGKERTPVLLEALGTTPGLLVTHFKFYSRFLLSISPAYYIIRSFQNLTASGWKAGGDVSINPLQLWMPP